jgi:hypothetical protein
MKELQDNQVEIIEGEKVPLLEKVIVYILRLLMWIHPNPFVFVREEKVVAVLNRHKVK